MRGPVFHLCVFACVFALAGAGCGGDASDSVPTVRVFAASSTVDVLGLAGELYAEAGGSIEFNYAGSSALREQILDGAEADVFISANVDVMQNLVDAGAASGEPVEVAQNTMTIAVPLGNPSQVQGLEDFANASLSLGLCAPGVPCGDLATRVLFGAGVQPSIDTLEPNVRSLLSKVELGELDAALVYRTDVQASDEVEGIELPRDAVATARYYAVAIDGSGPEAEQFVEYLLSAEVRELFRAAGFELP